MVGVPGARATQVAGPVSTRPVLRFMTGRASRDERRATRNERLAGSGSDKRPRRAFTTLHGAHGISALPRLALVGWRDAEDPDGRRSRARNEAHLRLTPPCSRGKAGPRPVSHDDMVAGDAASRANGEAQGRRIVPRETCFGASAVLRHSRLVLVVRLAAAPSSDREKPPRPCARRSQSSVSSEARALSSKHRARFGG